MVCVDPPRKGLSEDVVDTIAAMGPDRVVYVSCDPATLARDLARFAQRGYAAVRAAAVDMFPRTAHVETVVRLQRRNRRQLESKCSPLESVRIGRHSFYISPTDSWTIKSNISKHPLLLSSIIGTKHLPPSLTAFGPPPVIKHPLHQKASVS